MAVGALTGCQTLADVASGHCDGTGSRVDELKSQDILDSRPQGAIVPQGFEDLDAGCWEDSGEAWLFADRTYVFPGDKAEVIRHYRAAAEREGWKLYQAASQSSQSSQEDQSASALCFTPGKADAATTLDVYFLTEDILAMEETKTGPEFDSGAGYRVAIRSTADGSATSCSD